MARSQPKRLVLLGDPVAHSLSPQLQNAALRAAGIQLEYQSLRVPALELGDAAARLSGEEAAGNVTVPHKRQFLKLCSRVSRVAERVGAVNTFWTEAGELVGDNTDVDGFDRAVRKLLGRLDGVTVGIIGSGGSAAAVLGAVESWPNARAQIFARRPAQAEQLAARFGAFARAETTMQKALRGANLVVNATPVGMTDDLVPFATAELEPGTVLADLVYRKGGTALVRAARAAGFACQDGIEMLLEQGSLSFERWFGFAPDREVMRSALA